MGIKSFLKITKSKPAAQDGHNGAETGLRSQPQPEIASENHNVPVSPDTIRKDNGLDNNGNNNSENNNSNSNSNSFTSTNSLLSQSTIYNNIANYSQNPKISKELIPIITLLNCQNARIYAQSELYLNIEYNKATTQDMTYQLVQGVIKGNQFILSRDSSFKPISIDLLESQVKLQIEEQSFIITNSMKVAYHIKFTNLTDLQKWISAIKLSNFEYHKFSESYTASLLSAKGPTLSDLHVVLSPSRYDYEEWCSIKFGKHGKWINCYCVITPSDKSRKGTKNGTVQFYTSNKTSKRNLLCSVIDIEGSYAVYPHIDLIDESTLIRINGDIVIYNIDELTMNSPMGRSRSGSVASSIKNHHHRRNSSVSSLASNKAIKGQIINDTAIYVLPKPHNGVKSFETLIRFLIPVYDSFQLYGRPKRLNSDKMDPKSLLFGLPSLPHVELLTDSAAQLLVRDNWDSIVRLEALDNFSEDSFDFTGLFISQIKEYYNGDSKHQGFGDLKKTLLKEMQFENPLVTYNSYSIPGFDSGNTSPIVRSTPQTPDLSISDGSFYDVQANQNSSNSLSQAQQQAQSQLRPPNIVRSGSNYKLHQVVSNDSISLAPPPTEYSLATRTSSNGSGTGGLGLGQGLQLQSPKLRQPQTLGVPPTSNANGNGSRTGSSQSLSQYLHDSRSPNSLALGSSPQFNSSPQMTYTSNRIGSGAGARNSTQIDTKREVETQVYA